MKPLSKCTVCWLASLTLMAAGLVFSGCETPRRADDPTIWGQGPVGAETAGQIPIGPSTNPVAPTEGVRLKVEDTVKVTFSGTSVLIPQHVEKINEDGKINLHHIGAVPAAGRTPAELAQIIRDLYVPKYYRTLNVVVETEGRTYVVGGEVRRPEKQWYMGPTTVLKAIESAGGFTDFAAKRRVTVTRANGEIIRVDCIRAQRDPSEDRPVYPGDLVRVPRRGPFEF
jgi:protein involved in polysaccharide export with SLBB domain